jgi:kumamolisin
MRTSRFFCFVLFASAVGCSNGSVPIDGAQLNPRVSQSIDLGRVAPSSEFDFVIGMRLRSVDALNRFLVDKATTGDSLSPEDFGEMFGPSANEYSRLAGWLRSQGLDVTRLVGGRTTLSVHGVAELIERAFNIEIHEYVDAAGNHFEAADRVLQFPVESVTQVVGAVGLDGSPRWFWNHFVVDPSASPPPAGSETAATLETLYKAPAGTTNPGLGETVAILGAGFGPALATDLNGVKGYMATSKPYGLTSIPATGGGYSVVNVGGPNRDLPSDAMGEQFENDLDADMVLAFAPYAKIVHVLTATNSPGLFTDGITYIVNNVKDAHQVTVSYGSCERGAAGQMPVMNALFAQAQAESQQWFFAAGDSGTDGCRDYPKDANGNASGPGANKVGSAGWPASSPYVVSVGGTQLSGTTEQAWVNGGGGPSESLDKPAFQSGTVTPADSSRDTPDVAALAGTPFINIVFNGATAAVGGTSAATPMWAAIWALNDQNHGGKGFTDGLTHLYKLAGTAGLTDITAGAINGPDGPLGSLPGYSAGAKYDLATGLGSPVITSIFTSWQ